MGSKYIYSDAASEKLWRQVTPADKKEARKIYKKCLKSTNKKEWFTVTNRKVVMNAIEVMFFPFDDNFGKTWWWADGNQVEVSIKLFNVLVTKNKIIQDELKRIKRKLGLGSRTPKEKVRVIHEYICDSVEYDYTFKGGTSLFEALFTRKLVCQGYSLMLKSLCDLSGVQCECLTNENHMWNRVFIDNKWNYIDATWDDTNNRSKYFLLPEKYFYSIHPKHISISKDFWVK